MKKNIVAGDRSVETPQQSFCRIGRLSGLPIRQKDRGVSTVSKPGSEDSPYTKASFFTRSEKCIIDVEREDSQENNSQAAPQGEVSPPVRRRRAAQLPRPD